MGIVHLPLDHYAMSNIVCETNQLEDRNKH